jgi:hypothetical protein
MAFTTRKRLVSRFRKAKIDAYTLYYSFFYVFIFLFFFLYPIADKKPFFILLILGFWQDNWISFLSIFIANLFIKYGIERTIKTIGQQGIFNVLLTDFTVALILGGWLIGTISIIMLKLAVKLVGRISEA